MQLDTAVCKLLRAAVETGKLTEGTAIWHNGRASHAVALAGKREGRK
jgi:hypothetical protein